VAGQAFLGKQGIQRAEYLAAIYGLHAVLRYSRLHTVKRHRKMRVDRHRKMSVVWP
jgi:hypothetical protein